MKTDIFFIVSKFKNGGLLNTAIILPNYPKLY